MKTVLLLVFASLLVVSTAMAQECQPDATLPDDELGVFPMPYDETENPEGGITDTACVGAPYNFVLTTVVGEVFRLNNNELDLDSLTIKRNGAVDGLPKGVDYACNPPNCSFKKESKGCIVLYGMPEAGTEGSHKLKISGKLYVNGSPIGLNLNFPNQSIAPGDYTVVVGKGEEAPCNKSSIDGHYIERGVSIYPNPIAESTIISSVEPIRIDVYSALGELMLSKNQVEYHELDTREWPSGIYYLHALGKAHGQTKVLVKP